MTVTKDWVVMGNYRPLGLTWTAGKALQWVLEKRSLKRESGMGGSFSLGASDWLNTAPLRATLSFLCLEKGRCWIHGCPSIGSCATWEITSLAIENRDWGKIFKLDWRELLIGHATGCVDRRAVRTKGVVESCEGGFMANFIKYFH